MTEQADRVPPEAARTTDSEAARTTEPEAARTTDSEAARTTEPEAARTTESEAAGAAVPAGGERTGDGPDAAQVARAQALAREIFSGVASKWALPLIDVLAERTLRFTEIRGEVPDISQKMLTQTLRGLERDGLVERTVHATVPPRVEYALTAAGRALRSRVNGLCDWTRQYLQDIEVARHRHDVAD
ncbi:winged helix-turn-helix transcriptional regulator [Streptomyces sp. NPDC087849]|uniref:winged helix-turn-helix transcriptional regulator n=1 Tax=Streptomyces sp. NPDC087849 TaxID=3365808 RepID=UPI0038208D91